MARFTRLTSAIRSLLPAVAIGVALASATPASAQAVRRASGEIEPAAPSAVRRSAAWATPAVRVLADPLAVHDPEAAPERIGPSPLSLPGTDQDRIGGSNGLSAVALVLGAAVVGGAISTYVDDAPDRGMTVGEALGFGGGALLIGWGTFRLVNRRSPEAVVGR